MGDPSDDEDNLAIGSDGGTEDTDVGVSDDEGSVASFDGITATSPPTRLIGAASEAAS